VNAVGRFIKSVAGVKDALGLAFDLGPVGASEHIADDGARMAVGAVGFAGGVVDFDEGDFEMSAVEPRKRLGEKGVVVVNARWRRRSGERGRDGAAGERGGGCESCEQEGWLAESSRHKFHLATNGF
jgi:hypothetical protein